MSNYNLEMIIYTVYFSSPVTEEFFIHYFGKCMDDALLQAKGVLDLHPDKRLIVVKIEANV
jgi:hypothetical protein